MNYTYVELCTNSAQGYLFREVADIPNVYPDDLHDCHAGVYSNHQYLIQHI